MNYQAIAFDLDGTLLSSQATILEANKQAISQVRARGIKVFIVTGRHHTAVRPYYAELGLDTPVVCCNGTYLYDFAQDKILDSNPLTPTLAQSLIGSAQKEGIHVAVYTDKAMTYEVLNAHFEKLLKWVASCPENVRPNVHQVESYCSLIEQGTPILKILVSDPNKEKLQNFIKSQALAPINAEWSWVDRVDISAQGNSKGVRLLQLLVSENIDPAKVIAFGDNFNDISMLKAVGMGIAMGESEPEVQQSAKRVIGSHNQDSIAQTLVELFDL